MIGASKAAPASVRHALTVAIAGAIWIGPALQGPANAQLAVSANDGHVAFVDGTMKVVADGKDSIAVFDLSKSPPAKIAEIEVPASVVGPPHSVAVTPDERYAIVTSSMKIDPADPAKQIADNRVTLIELPAQSIAAKIKGKITDALKKTDPNAPQAKIAQTIEAGAAPAGVSINRKGDLVLVANRNEGSISIFTLKAGKLEAKGKLAVGDAKSSLGHVAITPDGQKALVTRDGDNMISVLNIEGDKVELAKRDIYAGLRPYGLSISNDGRYAAVANIGRGQGDADTISLIDLSKDPYRVVDTVSVGQTPEGIQISPDNKYVAVTVLNGSNKPKNSPFYNESGRLQMYAVAKDLKLAKVSEIKIGGVSQGVAFSRNGRTILVQNLLEKEIQVLTNASGRLTDTNQRIKLTAGPAGLRTAEPPYKPGR
jgi:DNA-binding beta-propeller fold protein YncE